MKKFLSVTICLTMAVCSALYASAAEISFAESEENVSINKSESAANCKNYFENTIVPKYGYADMSNKYLKDRWAFDNMSKWCDRNGVAGYDIADLNNDSEEDLLVYRYDTKTNGTRDIYVDYYQQNNGTFELLAPLKLHSTAAWYCDYFVVGILKNKGKNYMVAESYTCPGGADDVMNYWIYDFSLVRKPMQSIIVDWITLNTGNYTDIISTEYNKRKTTVFKNERANNGSAGMIASVNQALTSAGFPKMTNTNCDIAKSLNGTMFCRFPTYYGTAETKRSFFCVDLWDKNKEITTNYTGFFSNGAVENKKASALADSPVKYGDMDGDNAITSADSLLILRASVGLENLNSRQRKAADVNSDNLVGSDDALEVLRYSVGLNSEKRINTKI